jgi:predicted pyridoxine 5'-phosphate oxidase superfamily flavin-nucleotide-binding protein
VGAIGTSRLVVVRRDVVGIDGAEVGQSFGNCPRYIQNRHFDFIREPTETNRAGLDVADMLTEAAQQIIAKADTFFVASYVDRGDQGRQVDVSHRGGRPGFVRIDADGGLTVPDFNGNLFFNTLGNIRVNPFAGLLFFDEATGDILQLSGRAEVILDSPEIAAFEGAERPLTTTRRPKHDPSPLRALA